MKSKKFHILSIFFSVIPYLPLISVVSDALFGSERSQGNPFIIGDYIVLGGSFYNNIVIVTSLVFFFIAIYFKIKRKEKLNIWFILNILSLIMLALVIYFQREMIFYKLG